MKTTKTEPTTPKAQLPTQEQAQKFKTHNPDLRLAQDRPGFKPRGPLTPTEWAQAMDKEHKATVQMIENQAAMDKADAQLVHEGALQAVAEMKELFAASRARQAAHGAYSDSDKNAENEAVEKEYAETDAAELAKIKPDCMDIVLFPRTPLRVPAEESPSMTGKQKEEELAAMEAEQEEFQRLLHPKAFKKHV